jgi:HSP20 family protein
MTLVRRTSPLGELVSLRQAMDRLFEDSFVRPRVWTGWSDATTLAMDIRSTADALIVEAALPGIKPEDVDITVEGGTLTITGEYGSERKEEEGDYLVQELRRGSFGRTVTLPEGLEPDRATATFEHGVLTLRIPKAEEIKPRQIKISPTASDPGRDGGSGEQG